MKSYRPKVCLDSSVLVKWFNIEEGSTEAIEIRRWAEEAKIKLVISALVITECARALKKVGFHNDKIYEIMDLFDAFIRLCRVEVVPVDWLIIKSAQSFVIEHNLYSADAIHAATAVLNESDFFISVDDHHFKESLKLYLEKKNVHILRVNEAEKILVE